MQTDIVNFKNPHTLRNKLGRAAWSLVWATLFRPTPQFMGAWRSLLLSIFGAKIGRARLHQSVRIWAPWLLQIGRDVYIDRDVFLYNPYGIAIGDRNVISFGAQLCTASHDYHLPDFPLVGGKIVVGDDTWIAAGAFIAPGVTVGSGAVIAARAVVVKDVQPWTVVAGNPARVIKTRELRPANTPG